MISISAKIADMRGAAGRGEVWEAHYSVWHAELSRLTQMVNFWYDKPGTETNWLRWLVQQDMIPKYVIILEEHNSQHHSDIVVQNGILPIQCNLDYLVSQTKKCGGKRSAESAVRGHGNAGQWSSYIFCKHDLMRMFHRINKLMNSGNIANLFLMDLGERENGKASSPWTMCR